MTGDRIPGTEELYRMAKILDVSMEFLLTGQKDNVTEWQKRAQAAEAKLEKYKSVTAKFSDLTQELTRLAAE